MKKTPKLTPRTIKPVSTDTLQGRNFGSGILNTFRLLAGIPWAVAQGPIGAVKAVSEALLRQILGSHLVYQGIGDAMNGRHHIRATILAILLAGSAAYSSQYFENAMKEYANSLPQPEMGLDQEGARNDVTTALNLSVDNYAKEKQKASSILESIAAQIRTIIEKERKGEAGSGAQGESAAYNATKMILESGDPLPNNWGNMDDQQKEKWVTDFLTQKNSNNKAPGYTEKVAKSVVQLLSKYPDIQVLTASTEGFSDSMYQKVDFTSLDAKITTAQGILQKINFGDEQSIAEGIKKIQKLLTELQNEYTTMSNNAEKFTNNTNAVLAGLGENANTALKDSGVATNASATTLEIQIPTINTSQIPTLEEIKNNNLRPKTEIPLWDNPETWKTIGNIGYWALLIDAYLDILLLLYTAYSAKKQEQRAISPLSNKEVYLSDRENTSNALVNIDGDGGGALEENADQSKNGLYIRKVRSLVQKPEDEKEKNAEAVATAYLPSWNTSTSLPVNNWLAINTTAYSQMIDKMIGSIPIIEEEKK